MADNHPAGEAETVDARGLACPLPVLKLRRALKRCVPGATVMLLATDPVAARDVPAFCAANGHEMIAQSRDGAVLRFEVRA